MSNPSPLQLLSHLASGLGEGFDAKGMAGFFFFNTVKFVKFIRLPARNMNGGGGYLSVSLPR